MQGRSSIRRCGLSSGLVCALLYDMCVMPCQGGRHVACLDGGVRERVGCWGSRRALFLVQTGLRSVHTCTVPGPSVCRDLGPFTVPAPSRCYCWRLALPNKQAPCHGESVAISTSIECSVEAKILTGARSTAVVCCLRVAPCRGLACCGVSAPSPSSPPPLFVVLLL